VTFLPAGFGLRDRIRNFDNQIVPPHGRLKKRCKNVHCETIEKQTPVS
jgi:hypothetical protein